MLVKNPILQVVAYWFKRNFSDPEALGLFFTLLLGFIILEFFGHLLLPILVSIVIAYLLYSPVRCLVRLCVPHFVAVLIVYLLFMGFVAFVLLGLLPLLWKQSHNLLKELAMAFDKGQIWIVHLMHHYPKIFRSYPLQQAVIFSKQQSAKIGQIVLSFSLSTIPSLITIGLYFILVPLLVFFFLKDTTVVNTWLSRFLPSNIGLVQMVWSEVNKKIGAYVRGRVIEIIIVGTVSSITFGFLGLQYATLLGALVGLSVIVPYVGAIVATIPIVIIGLMEWGLSKHFSYLMIAYAVIITIDANILVPLLFSEAMDLHPLVIIISVFIFGGLWGFWGVFFAIPLATLAKAVFYAWPKVKVVDRVP